MFACFGVSQQYELAKVLLEPLKGSLRTIEELEAGTERGCVMEVR